MKESDMYSENMTNDYVNPKQKEKQLRNRTNRRTNWASKPWKTNKNGTYYLIYEERLLLVFVDKRTSKYKVKIHETFGKKSFDTLVKSKIAIFNGIEYLKEKDLW